MLTSIQSSAIKGLSLTASFTHSLYKLGTNKLEFWTPHLLNWNVRATFNLHGQRFIFDEPAEVAKPADTLTKGAASPPTVEAYKPKGWNANISYYFAESGSGASYNKDAYVNITLNFNLTRNTSIAYSQRYDIDRGLTANNSVSITRLLHCWTGSLWWVPIGSNAGFGFKLYANAIPDLTIDNNYNSFTSSLRP